MGFRRDGSYFYGTTNRKADVYTCDIDPDTLQVTSLPRRLSDDFIGSNSGPAWSPDGKTVAFFRGPNPTAMSLVIRTIADGTERTLPTKLTDSILAGREGPVWMPDSRSLLVPDLDYAKARAMIRKVDVASGAEHVVLGGAGLLAASARVCRRQVGVLHEEGEGRHSRHQRLCAWSGEISTAARKPSCIAQESKGVGFFSLTVSPDGTQIAFMANEGGERTLMTVPTAGGPRRAALSRRV